MESGKGCYRQHNRHPVVMNVKIAYDKCFKTILIRTSFDVGIIIII